MYDKRLICVDGHGGSGKSTACQELAKSLSAVYLQGNTYFNQAISSRPDIFKNIYDVNPSSDPLGMRRVVLFGTTEQGSWLFKILTPIVDKLLQDEVDKIRKTSQDTFIIIDWHNIALTGLWYKAEYRILVDCDKEKLYEAFAARERKFFGHYTLELAKTRVADHTETVEFAKKSCNYKLFNNYDATFFEQITALKNHISQNT